MHHCAWVAIALGVTPDEALLSIAIRTHLGVVFLLVADLVERAGITEARVCDQRQPRESKRRTSRSQGKWHLARVWAGLQHEARVLLALVANGPLGAVRVVINAMIRADAA